MDEQLIDVCSQCGYYDDEATGSYSTCCNKGIKSVPMSEAKF